MTLTDAELDAELDSWGRFSNALRENDRNLFNEMLGRCREYFPAMQAGESPFPSESLFMSLLLVQHKAIVQLAGEVAKLKAEKDARLDT